MKPFLLSVALALLACLSSGSWAADGEEGFTAILDKDHTDGWKHIGEGDMEVRDGVASTVSPKGDKGGMYYYEKKAFGDFILRLEFKIDTETSNSGILVRLPDPVVDYATAAAKGYEVDIFGSKTGTLVFPPDRVRPSIEQPLDPGVWNACEVTATGQLYTVTLKGQKVIEYTGSRALSGYIGLQTWKGEGEVHFRHVRIKELAPTPSPSPVVSSPPAPSKTQPAHPVSAGDLIHDHSASLVIVKGDEGSGSGFICKSGNASFLYTNIHVVADLLKPTFTRMDGGAALISSAVLAAGRDIACLQVKNPPEHPLEVSTDFNDSVRIGDEVVVLGNSGGGGVVTAIKGAIEGIGPDRIEVSAKFVPGNSGSPIIHLNTGKVIGIATYLTMRNEDPGKATAVNVRRFGYRVDNVPKWEGVDWNLLRQEADSVKQVQELTKDIFDFLRALRTRQAPNFATATLRQTATEWMRTLRSRQLNEQARRAVTENFLRGMQRIVVADVLAVEPRLRYTYFKDEMHEQHEVRKRLYDAFNPESVEWSPP